MQNYREGRGQPMKPLIGLTPIVDAGRDSLWMLPGYMQGLEAVGGIGMMLPLTDDAAMLKDIVDRVDGLLLTGGNDVAPVLYGETKETFCGENDPRRDRMEARLIELALQADKPVFGICRGLQILNVVLGGTLYQDLKTQTGTEITHSMDKPYDRTVHEVNILPDTPLAALYGPRSAGSEQPPSSGHQGAGSGVACPGGGLGWADRSCLLAGIPFCAGRAVAPGTSLAGGGKPKFAAQFCGRLPGIIK